MKLVFFGGVHGVGKTTLLEKLSATSGGALHIIDPGELFWEHCYQKKDKTPDETEELVVELIERSCRLHPLVVCNWHYAVWTPTGYVPEVAFSRLATLIERVRPGCVCPILIHASADIVFERRKKDQGAKKRKIDLVAIEEEIAQTNYLYQLHHGVAASRAKTSPIVFDNSGPIEEGAVRALLNTLYENS